MRAQHLKYDLQLKLTTPIYLNIAFQIKLSTGNLLQVCATTWLKNRVADDRGKL